MILPFKLTDEQIIEIRDAIYSDNKVYDDQDRRTALADLLKIYCMVFGVYSQFVDDGVTKLRRYTATLTEDTSVHYYVDYNNVEISFCDYSSRGLSQQWCIEIKCSKRVKNDDN